MRGPAQARHALENYDGALDDLEAALEREPKNGGARSLMAECRRCKAAATPKPPPKLERVAIEAVLHDADNDDDPFVNALFAPPPPAAAPPAAPADLSELDADGSAAAPPDAPLAAPPPAASAAAPPPAAPRAAARVGVPSAAPTADAFGVPATLAEMERAWRSLRGQPTEFASLVRRVEPSKLRALFKNNLPAELFSALLVALDTTFFPEHAARALDVLRALTHAGRFAILTMCLDKADTAAIASIFAKLDEARADLPADADLPALRKQYA